MAKIADELDQALARRTEDGTTGQTTPRVIARGDGWTVADVLCTRGPHDRPFEERHTSICDCHRSDRQFSISFSTRSRIDDVWLAAARQRAAVLRVWTSTRRRRSLLIVLVRARLFRTVGNRCRGTVTSGGFQGASPATIASFIATDRARRCGRCRCGRTVGGVRGHPRGVHYTTRRRPVVQQEQAAVERRSTRDSSGPHDRSLSRGGAFPRTVGASGEAQPVPFPSHLPGCDRYHAPSVRAPCSAARSRRATGRRDGQGARHRARLRLRRRLQLQSGVWYRVRREPSPVPARLTVAQIASDLLRWMGHGAVLWTPPYRRPRAAKA